MRTTVIKIGSKLGVIIPDKMIDELGIKVGDKVSFILERADKVKHDKFAAEYDKFIEIYGESLKNLTD